MQRVVYTILAFLLFFQKPGIAQFQRQVDSLSRVGNTATRDEDKMAACSRLAELYYVYQLDNAGDSMLQKQLKIAEFAGKQPLILRALFDNAISNLTNWRSKESFDRALLFAQKGRDYAKAIGMDDYLTLAHVRIAGLYRKRGQPDNALYNANIAFTSALNIDNDSIKTVATIELGDAYQAKGESLLAFKTYTSAFEKAQEIENIPLQSEVYHRFADLYQSLDNTEEWRQYLLKSYDLNKENKNTEGLIRDNIDLARYTEERTYIENALHLAESFRMEKYVLQAKRIMYGYYTMIVANSDSTFHYIDSNEDLKLFFQNRGTGSYYYTKGTIFKNAGKLDSAVFYYLKAEPLMDSTFDIKNRQSVYVNIGECYQNMNLHKDAIRYYEKAFSYAINDPAAQADYSAALSKLYENTGDYKKAIFYVRNATSLSDSLEKLANQKDIALAQVNNEKREHEKELEQQQRQKITKRNLQYMAITILITVFFILMLVIGMFPVSRLTIKLCGYFVFISLFEFIVLLIDSWLHNIAHAEPLKIWLMKIVLIALLVPCQHFLEHKLTHYIESRKLHAFRKKLFSVTKKKSVRNGSSTIDDIESDTAVL